METNELIDKYLFGGNISNKKVRYTAAGTLLFAYVIGTCEISQGLKITLISNLILAFILRLIGRNRKIGFGKAFFGSLFLAPIVFFIAAVVFMVIK
jgi:hypothetical protein